MTGGEAAGILSNFSSVPILVVTLYITAHLLQQEKRVRIKGAVRKSDTVRSLMASKL